MYLISDVKHQLDNDLKIYEHYKYNSVDYSIKNYIYNKKSKLLEKGRDKDYYLNMWNQILITEQGYQKLKNKFKQIIKERK